MNITRTETISSRGEWDIVVAGGGLAGAAAFFLFGHRGLLGKSFVQYITKGRIRQVPAGKFRIALVLGESIVYNESVNINSWDAMRPFSTSPEGRL